MRLVVLCSALLLTLPTLAQGIAPITAPPPLPSSSTPPPLPSLPDFYLGLNGQPIGPLSELELRAYIGNGMLTPDTLVWTEGQAEWEAAKDVPAIAALLAQSVAPTVHEPVFAPATTPLDSGPAPAFGTGPAVTFDTPNTPAFDAASSSAHQNYLVGAWKVTGPVSMPELGETTADLVQTFMSDGTFNTRGMLYANIPGYQSPVEMSVEANGKWTVRTSTGERVEVEMASTTTVAAPALGLEPQSETTTDVAAFAIVDNDTLRDEDNVIWRRIPAQ